MESRSYLFPRLRVFIQRPVFFLILGKPHSLFYALIEGTVANTSRNPKEVTDRLDALIHEIRERWHRPALEEASIHGDVVLVAHGHILRAFAQRWTGRDLDDSPAFLMEAGGVGTLRYVLSCYDIAPDR